MGKEIISLDEAKEVFGGATLGEVVTGEASKWITATFGAIKIISESVCTQQV